MTYTREAVRCYNQLQGESKRHTHLGTRNTEMNVQMEQTGFSEVGAGLSLHWTEFICVVSQELFVLVSDFF